MKQTLPDATFEAVARELSYITSRSSGPGGQNVNKVNSKVTLLWNVSESVALTDEAKSIIIAKLVRYINKEGMLMISSQDQRTQRMNKEEVLRKLKALLIGALKERKKRKPTKASAAAKKKRLDSKKRDGLKKQWRRKID